LVPLTKSRHSKRICNWNSFRQLLKTQSRFFNSSARSLLDKIFTDLQELNAGRHQLVIHIFGVARPTRLYRGASPPMLPHSSAYSPIRCVKWQRHRTSMPG